MIVSKPTALAPLKVQVHDHAALTGRMPRLEAFFLARDALAPLSLHPRWLFVLAHGMGHVPIALELVHEEQTCGFLGLACVKSMLFGRFLVSMPYLNYGGPLATDEAATRLLIDKAVALADEHDVRYLELRNEMPLAHSSLNESRQDKVHMRLDLPGTPARLWQQLPAKVRNQVRKAQKHDLTVSWGARDLLDDFYQVFSRNMRDLGTPVYGKRLFSAILDQFPADTEMCVVRSGKKPVAAALLLHGRGITEVPSAGSLRKFNPTCANMLLYWQLLERAIERGQSVFDFGRSSKDSNTMRFKKQWGAFPVDAPWQYYVRSGSVAATRPDNPRYQKLIRIWQRLPVALTRLIGPAIVRGIP